MTALRTVASVVAEVVRLVLVQPVREGRLRAGGWPPGLAAAVGLATAAFLAAAALVLAAPTVRRHSDLVVGLEGSLVYPRWTTPVFLALTVLALALLHAASLHLTPWLRVAGLVVVVLAVLGSAVDTVEDNLRANVAGLVGAALLVVLTAVRWRAAYRWWELVVSLLVVGGSIGVASRFVADRVQPAGFDTAPTTVVALLQFVSSLAVPFTIVAGLAFAQLALLLTHRVGAVVEERVRPAAVVAGLVAVVAAVELVLVVLRLRRPSESGAGHLTEWAASAAVLVLGVGLALAVLRVARLEGRLLDRLEDAVSTVALPIGFALFASGLVAVLVGRLQSQALRFTGGEDVPLQGLLEALISSGTTSRTRLAIAAALIGWAWWQRRDRPLPAVLAATVGVVVGASALGTATGQRLDLPWTGDALSGVAAVAATGTLVALAATRRLDRHRLVALGTALGLSLAFSVRSAFDAPFVALLGLGATAAVFLGVLWTGLTGAGDANVESERYPRPARVLFFLANALLAMTTLAFVSVADTEGLGVDVSPFGALGDDLLGTGLLLAAYAVLAAQVLSPASRRCSPAS